MSVRLSASGDAFPPVAHAPGSPTPVPRYNHQPRRIHPMRLALLSLVLITGTSTAAEPALPYKIGVAKVDITPEHPIRLNGFGFRRTESEGVYQKVWAKALAIEDATGPPGVLMAVDVLGIPADVYDELARRLEKKAGLKKERLAVTATHT